MIRGVIGLWLGDCEVSPANSVDPIESSSDRDKAFANPVGVDVWFVEKSNETNGFSLRVLWLPNIMNLDAATVSPNKGA